MTRPAPPARKPRQDLGGGSLPFAGDFRSPYPPPGKRSRKGRDRDEGGVPVEPSRPNTLSGGAAAALEFDE